MTPSPREVAARRKRRLVGGAVVLLLLGGFAYSRVVQLGERDEAAVAGASAALYMGLRGHADGYALAQRAFGRAGRGSIVDAYPIFAAQFTRALASGDHSMLKPSQRPVYDALLAVDLERAARLTRALPDTEGRDWVARLVADLAAARNFF